LQVFPFAKSTLRSVTGSRKVSLKSTGGCGTSDAMGFALGFGKEFDRDSITDIHIRSTWNTNSGGFAIFGDLDL